MTDRLYTTAEVAGMLGVSTPLVKKIRALLKVGRKIGHVYVYTAADVEAMRRRNTRKGRPPKQP